MTIDVELPSTTSAPAQARGALDRMAGSIAPHRMRDVRLLVSELVTNAVRHGGADEAQTIIVHVAIAPDVLRVEVCDQGPGFTPPDDPLPRPEGGGNGLVLLSRMSSSWGVAGDEGTCVWFERMLPSPA